MQRFKQFNGSASKIDTKVSFPLKLEMLPYTNRARSQDTKQNFELARSCTYDLQSVVVHVGNLETGKTRDSFLRSLLRVFLTWQAIMSRTRESEIRYAPYLFCRRRHANEIQWFKFNDHNVTLASKSQVLNEQAFLLFYVIQSLA